jgi:hypothetical protein
MSYHPDSSMPGCMMPDGGDCCPAHAELVSEWNGLREHNAKLAAALSGARAIIQKFGFTVLDQIDEALADQQSTEKP